MSLQPRQKLAGIKWSVSKRATILLLLLTTLGFQMVKAMAWYPLTGGFQQKYWSVDYSFGFVRRGLAGEILRLFAPSTNLPRFATVLSVSLCITALILLGALIWKFWLADNDLSMCVTICLLCAPYGIEFLLRNMRTDLFGFILFGAFVIVLGRHKTSSLSGTHFITGILLAICTLIHEATFFELIPFLLIASAMQMSTDFNKVTRRFRLFALIAPPMGTMVLLALFGQRDPIKLSQIRLTAEADGFDGLDTNSKRFEYFDWFEKSLRENVSKVWHTTGFDKVLGTLAFASVLITCTGLILGPRIRHSFVFNRRYAPWIVFSFASYFILFATALDWNRWVCLWLLCTVILIGLESSLTEKAQLKAEALDGRKSTLRIAALSAAVTYFLVGIGHFYATPSGLRQAIHDLLGF